MDAFIKRLKIGHFLLILRRSSADLECAIQIFRAFLNTIHNNIGQKQFYGFL